METKHTKGEWRISRTEHDNIIHIDARRPNERQTILTIETETEKESLANAKLIVAAPELLEAINYYFDVLREVRGSDWRDKPDHVLQKMITAYDKAVG